MPDCDNSLIDLLVSSEIQKHLRLLQIDPGGNPLFLDLRSANDISLFASVIAAEIRHRQTVLSFTRMPRSISTIICSGEMEAILQSGIAVHIAMPILPPMASLFQTLQTFSIRPTLLNLLSFTTSWAGNYEPITKKPITSQRWYQQWWDYHIRTKTSSMRLIP